MGQGAAAATTLRRLAPVPVLEVSPQARARAHAPARPAHPVSVAIAHNKGGVSKTTSTYLLGRHLARDLRVELVDLDHTQYLREAVAQLSPRGDLSLSPRLWLRNGEPRPPDVGLLHSQPARGPAPRPAPLMADHVLIPV